MILAALKRLLNQGSYIKDLKVQVEKQGLYPAGHYYSPIPSKEEVDKYLNSETSSRNRVLGIDINEQGQYDLIKEYAHFYNELPFSETQKTDQRYYYNNEWFSYSDAIFLYCFLRYYKPKKIIEVGSGFSSAVMLDTIDGFSKKPQISFIEPYPDRLLGLLREDDRKHATLIDKKIQDVSPDFFSLEAGDLLFIDSSHVVKCGSDLHYLFFEIIPLLKSGVFVHFHDVFYPFEYPSAWLEEGRFWNENYFLRAFLSYNSEWEIKFFNAYVHHVFRGFIKERMPLCTKNTGGSLYLQRT